MKPIYLYGISGVRDAYRVVRYEAIYTDEITNVIDSIKYTASMMRIKNPSIERVFAMDQRYGLRHDYIEALKKDSIESWFIFRDILETEGMEVILPKT